MEKKHNVTRVRKNIGHFLDIAVLDLPHLDKNVTGLKKLDIKSWTFSSSALYICKMNSCFGCKDDIVHISTNIGKTLQKTAYIYLKAACRLF